MPSPLFNLMVFFAAALVVGLVFWPRRGALSRARRQRTLARRALLEDALKHVFKQDRRGQTATLVSVGGAVEVGAAKAVELVEKMQDAGFVTFTDGRILLTEEGRRYAMQVIRAHRLWERYLADETGVDPLDWHHEAERREHTLTQEETDALDERLGFPRFDPHGDPIPTATGDFPPASGISLSALEEGDVATVTHVEDEPHVVYAQLVALGVNLGMVVRVEEKTAERIVFESEGKRFVLAPLVADNVSVKRVDLSSRGEAPGGALTLATLGPGEAARVAKISAGCRGLERRRLMDLGIVPGTQVAFERDGLTGGLTAYRVRDTVVALRDEQAMMIAVDKVTKGAVS